MADMISEINESLAEKGSNCEGLPECCQLLLGEQADAVIDGREFPLRCRVEEGTFGNCSFDHRRATESDEHG